MFKSTCEALGAVSFPEFTGERIYMEKFFKDKGLPEHLKRWQPTIDQMLEKIDIDEPMYLMVDQRVVEPNTTHRRPGVHIDGYWIDHELYGKGIKGRHDSGHRPYLNAVDAENPYITDHHGNIIGRNPNCPKTPITDTHGNIRGWNDPREEIPDYDSHGNIRGWKKNDKRMDSLIISNDWSKADFEEPESLLLASDYASCKGYLGDWSGEIRKGGDCSLVDLSNLTEIILQPNQTYRGNVSFLHESLPINVKTQRTLVRINLKGQ